MKKLVKTWRWFGEDDSIRLEWLKELGIEEVVTALHHIPNGAIWQVEEIAKRKNVIKSAGLKWTVVESLPVTEEIKTGSKQRKKHLQHYKSSLRNLAQCGIKTVVYNFMPVLDWVRTDLNYRLPTGGESMRFDFDTFAAFDLFLLKRPGAENDYTTEMKKTAKNKYENFSEQETERLAHIILETQGFIDGAVDANVDDFKEVFLNKLHRYKNIGEKELRANLAYFLKEVIPVAEEAGINLAIHPDDPPFPVLGLPRILSSSEDISWFEKTCPSPNNGLAFCTGSFSARRENSVIQMAQQFSHRIHFAHLRNTFIEKDGSFYESGHSHGGVNMSETIKILLKEMKKRKNEGRKDYQIPVRPDHGIKYLDDFNLSGNPGYPFLGRLTGLKEICGMEAAILNEMD